MHLIENHALHVPVQKNDRVVFGKVPHVKVLQRVVRQVRKLITDQRCLAGLTGISNQRKAHLDVEENFGKFNPPYICRSLNKP